MGLRSGTVAATAAAPTLGCVLDFSAVVAGLFAHFRKLGAVVVGAGQSLRQRDTETERPKERES